jgi:inner membrane protein
MASIFGHVIASSALGVGIFPKHVRIGSILLTGFCAFAPDLDVIGFRMGVDYGSQWGHRGFTHSLVFALVFGCLMAWIFVRDKSRLPAMMLWCVLSTASHPILDMLTTGGRGIALWWPFSLERIFFPIRPILVSPISIGAFFSDWGQQVLWSEAKWIALPGIVFIFVFTGLRRLYKG